MKYEISCSYCGHDQIYSPRNDKIPKKPHTKCKKCGKEFNINIDVSENIPRVPKIPKSEVLKKNQNPPHFDKSPQERVTSSPSPLSKEELINKLSNPVEFVQSIIVEELVKTRDVRWAQLFTTILDKTNKLDYETIKEEQWLNQAKSMTMEELVKKIAIKGSISRSTSRRLDELEDTSQLDNFLDV